MEVGRQMATRYGVDGAIHWTRVRFMNRDPTHDEVVARIPEIPALVDVQEDHVGWI